MCRAGRPVYAVRRRCIPRCGTGAAGTRLRYHVRSPACTQPRPPMHAYAHTRTHARCSRRCMSCVMLATAMLMLKLQRGDGGPMQDCFWLCDRYSGCSLDPRTNQLEKLVRMLQSAAVFNYGLSGSQSMVLVRPAMMPPGCRLLPFVRQCH